MNLFVLNLLLAIGWCALFADFTLLNLAIGFAMGFAALWVANPLFGGTAYFGRVLRLISLGGYFLYELVVSSLQVVWDVITPVHKSQPGIIAVPLDVEDPAEIAVLANLISLTPGTLSLDVSDDKKFLYVHGMFVEDPDILRREIKAGMERKVMEAMR
ncbi:Na+/H+ antiporter subunit E [Algihabitans albus]|uniref:Na+/H+ antiporter subunit E n=1 Tax=Algihabitans albus TaxID=2164067 RepID=UPI000E5D3E94|nr:Na+/H+ antiporter subunit E [Algihabitans albus]